MKLFEGFGFFEKKNPPNVNEFHLLSYLTLPPLLPFIPPYIYIRGIIGVEILGRQ